ncbi:uncharacterized protein TRIVIDRAFT_48367 [Trichoderma virens Gv29-8]|uniref:BZIP domain-containing protein n=1 Tax=Hypocrea virens (strain Gv29-8 / FGSC 10586) TaxID=413071 RepID=G9MZ59_HYPVG|nr:uncharacterized protein TRIVIDRAFT_48367 [Trichoderma virens Gv29-8]EHK20386.1 hypothetical protein TRIVIDRAFT_48367 [Trichoderma virens Gv29-8]UKZ47044.1 hypothetical protein TrVGV298_001256 [Trichoderma virens]
MVGGECSSQANNTGKPRSRQRTHKPAPALDVPDIEENAPERKRILNVLAQRRYREKKRLRRQNERNKEKGQEIKETSNITGEAQDNNDREIDAEFISTSGQSQGTSGLNEIDFSLAGWTTTMFNNNISGNASMPLLLTDTSIFSDFSSTSITEESSGEEGLVFSNSESLDGNLTDILPPTWDSSSPSSSSDGSFADSYLLPVHELTLLRAVMRIAERIGCRQSLWNLEAVSPFSQGTATPSEQLPFAWKPTASQLLVPHHPLLDFLPWPGVRDRVINIFSMPDEMRPPNATGPLALVNFAYDIEDNSEGVRIYGGDPYDPNSWEVGQVLFERWWFIFDRDVIENSNRWRRLRGAPPLALKGMPS